MVDNLKTSQDQKEDPAKAVEQTQDKSLQKTILPRFFWVKVMIVSLVMITGAIFCYDKYFSQKVVVFDLQGYIVAINKLAMKKEISEQQYKERLDAIEVMINDLPKNYVLVVTTDTTIAVKNAKTIEPK